MTYPCSGAIDGVLGDMTLFAPPLIITAAELEELLAILTNPNIVFLLLTIGVQAILIEISSPGGWVAGFIGVVCLALAAYGLGVLPVNWFGIVLLASAFVLFILDIKAPTHGALTVAGVASLIIGALVLFNSPSVPVFQRVSVPLIIFTSMLTGAMFFGVLMFAIRARFTPIRMGVESLVGRVGFAMDEPSPRGQVRLGGEQSQHRLVERDTGSGPRDYLDQVDRLVELNPRTWLLLDERCGEVGSFLGHLRSRWGGEPIRREARHPTRVHAGVDVVSKNAASRQAHPQSEVTRQLWGEAGACQIDGARVRLAQNIGGSDATIVTHVLRRG